MGLQIKKMHSNAIVPTVAHAGEDLGFDLYSLEKVILISGELTKVRTGIAARFIDDNKKYTALGGSGGQLIENIYGLIIKDRSSMASKGITVSAGVIDAGYTNEILVLLTNNDMYDYTIEAQTKIAQMIPVKVETHRGISVVDELPKSKREFNGFGSTPDTEVYMAVFEDNSLNNLTDEQLDEKIQKLTRIVFSNNWNLSSQAKPMLMMFMEEQGMRNAKKFEEHLEKSGIKVDEIINIG